MIIAIDIDGTLTDQHEGFDLYEEVLKRNRIPYRLDKTVCRLQDRFGVSQEIHDFVWRFVADKFHLVTPREFAREVIQQLRIDGHVVYFMTARDPESTYGCGLSTEVLTKQVLNAADIPYDGIFFTAKKGEKCKELGVDLVIEDDPGFIMQIKKHNPECQVVVMGSEYNSGDFSFPVSRARNWGEVYSCIQMLTTQQEPTAESALSNVVNTCNDISEDLAELKSDIELLEAQLADVAVLLDDETAAKLMAAIRPISDLLAERQKAMSDKCAKMQEMLATLEESQNTNSEKEVQHECDGIGSNKVTEDRESTEMHYYRLTFSDRAIKYVATTRDLNKLMMHSPYTLARVVGHSSSPVVEINEISKEAYQRASMHALCKIIGF